MQVLHMYSPEVLLHCTRVNNKIITKCHKFYNVGSRYPVYCTRKLKSPLIVVVNNAVYFVIPQVYKMSGIMNISPNTNMIFH